MTYPELTPHLASGLQFFRRSSPHFLIINMITASVAKFLATNINAYIEIIENGFDFVIKCTRHDRKFTSSTQDVSHP